MAKQLINPVTGTGFPNNQVPVSQLNSSALALFKYGPWLFLAFALFYLFGLGVLSDQSLMVRWGIVLGAGYLGFYMPSILVKNRVQKRQTSIKRAWPDALDLQHAHVRRGSGRARVLRVGRGAGRRCKARQCR